MDYEATIQVDGVYVGKSAYRRQRVLNTAKMAGVVLTSAISSPLGGVAAGLLLDAGLTYIDGKLNKTVEATPPSGSTVAWDSTGWSSPWGCQTAPYCTAKAAAEMNIPTNCGPLSNWVVSRIVLWGDKTSASVYCRRLSDGVEFPASNIGHNGGPYVPASQQVPVSGPTDADALSALQSKITGMTPTAAHALGDWALSQGIAVGTITDYNGNTLAGPFEFPLPAKTSSSIDPTTGIRYDTNVVQAVHVEPNLDAATSEADPMTLTLDEKKTETATKPDGSKETKVTDTRTTQAPSRQEAEPEPVASFSGPEGTLYEKKTKTFEDVLTKFKNTVSAAPWMVAAKGFFTVNIAGGTCPQWSVAASEWLPAMDAGPYVCSQTMITLYQLGGVIVLAVAAWAAFRIALL